MIDMLAPHDRQQNPGKPSYAHGHVIGYNSGSQVMTVQLDGWPRSQAYDVPKGRWTPRANLATDIEGGAAACILPAAGDACLIVTDNLGDVWVPVYGID